MSLDCRLILIICHLNVVGGERFVVFHYLAGEDEAKIFNRSPGKLCRNGFLELGSIKLMRAKKKDN